MFLEYKKLQFFKEWGREYTMRIPKRYGQSQILACPFCGKQCITKNKQKVPVCVKHKDKLIDNWKCVCGAYLDIVEGKWGPYCRCIKCGAVNFKRALELNPIPEVKEPKKEEPSSETKPKQETVKADDPRYFDWAKIVPN